MNILLKLFAFSIIFIFILLHLLGVKFDRLFWNTFLQGLIPNLFALSIAVLVIQQLEKKERKLKIQKINKNQSEFIMLQISLLCMDIMDYLGIESPDKYKPEIGYSEKYNKIVMQDFITHHKNGTIEKTVYEKLFNSSKSEVFISEFNNILEKRSEVIRKNMKKINPYPEPNFIRIFSEDIYSCMGYFSAFGKLIDEKNRIKNDSKFEDSPEVFDKGMSLILNLTYQEKPKELLTEILNNIIEINERAKNNELFLMI